MSTADTDDLSPDDAVTAVDGIGPSRGETLSQAGYETVGDLQQSDVTDLLELLPDDVAVQVKETVGDRVGPLTTAAEARDVAQDIPGAKAKVVKGPDGKQRPKVLEKDQEHRVEGATVEIHKG